MTFFFFKQKTAYEMRISDWSSDVCSSDLHENIAATVQVGQAGAAPGKIDRHVAHEGCPPVRRHRAKHRVDGSLKAMPSPRLLCSRTSPAGLLRNKKQSLACQLPKPAMALSSAFGCAPTPRLLPHRL